MENLNEGKEERKVESSRIPKQLEEVMVVEFPI